MPSIIGNLFSFNFYFKQKKMSSTDLYALMIAKTNKTESRIQKWNSKCVDCKNLVEEDRNLRQNKITALTNEFNKTVSDFVFGDSDNIEKLQRVAGNTFKSEQLLWQNFKNIRFCEKHAKREKKIKFLARKILVIKTHAELKEKQELKK